MTQLPTFLLLAALACSASALDTSEWCSDAACCKKNARNEKDGKVCDDFYNASIGLSYSMFTSGGWWREAAWPVTDSVFHSSPPSKRVPDEQQMCVSISHSGKRSCPYPGAGAWGVALSVGPDSNFWEYFQTCPNAEMCAQCHDGFKCAIGQRSPLKKGWTYDKFQQVKNSIVDPTGTGSCWPHVATAYNEFDTNGMSSKALAGVFIPTCLARLTEPSSVAVCKTLRNNGGAGHWPVYVYDQGGMGNQQGSSSLRIDRYMLCLLEDEANTTISV